MKHHKYGVVHETRSVCILEVLQNLLFELAGTDRLSILIKLKKGPLKLSGLSRELDLSVQEASRNSQRLMEVGLISRGVDGSFVLTPYGEESLNLLEGFQFLSRNRGYFTTHKLSTLPRQFSDSLASLRDSQMVEDVMVAFSNVESMIQKAQEYVWILSNQVLVSTLPLLVESLARGAEFKLILPSDVVPPSNASERASGPGFMEAMLSGKFEIRFRGTVDVLICLSERELAALCFPDMDGKLDYQGFHAADEALIGWAKALFLHYWGGASKREPPFGN